MSAPPVNLFGGTINTLSTSLDMRSRNHALILDNVANADTPNYKSVRMDVEKTLQQSAEARPAPALQRTDAHHLSGPPSPDGESSLVERTEDDPLLLRGDGNTVNMDAEMAALAKNSLLYKASAQLVASKFRGLKNVITGGTK